MDKNIYKLAIECMEFDEQEIKIAKSVIPYQNLFFSDYTIQGNIKNYEQKLSCLREAIKDKYPSICIQMQEHMDKYDKDKIVHQSALEAIVRCVVSLEEPIVGSKKIFISHSSEDEVVINGFIEKILMLGCGFKKSDIFCTLDHTAIRTGDYFRDEIIKNMKGCDYILCMISDNYRKSEVCQNELGAAWAMTGKRVLPFKFPNINFKEIGFLNVVKQTADLTDKSKLDELYDELCRFYDLPQDWRNFNQQKDDFIKVVNENLYE